MATNDLTISQISTVLNSIVGQATGKTALAALDGSNFATVAQTALKCGYDTLINAISQVSSDTIFSVRPYNAKFGGLRVTNQRFGNMVRKLQVGDSNWEDDDRQKLVDGSSIDMYTVKKPSVLQTNFYGQNIYQRHYTVFRDQLDVAFSNAGELAQFWSMLVTNVNDQIEQAHENLARALVANLIASLHSGSGGSSSVIHCLTEYNDKTGLELTAETVMQPENYIQFMKWLNARIRSVRSLMTERTVGMFHMDVTGKEIARHTPWARQRMYLFAPTQFELESVALTSLFNDKYIKLGYNELVNFWQSIKDPQAINIKPVYMKNDGTITQPTDAVSIKTVLGVVYDEEALGYTGVNNWSAPTPLNARGGYYNIFYHFTDRYWMDNTENAILLLLD